MPDTSQFCLRCRQWGVVTDGVCQNCGAGLEVSGESTEGFGRTVTEQTVDYDHGQEPPPSRFPPPPDLNEELVGQPLDIYQVERLLGRGGMAWVFLARHENLHRPCALKILCPERQGRKAGSLDAFIAEARAAASIVHPHIVTVHNIGCQGERHYIELEYVPGASLDRHIGSEGLSIIKTAQVMAQACSALAQAHESGLVHRDFKPANIMVRDDGVAKLADFGLAKQLDQVSGGRERLAGTPFFMAPELFKRKPATQATDVYAVGVSLYRLLTAGYPFDHPRWPELARLHVEAPVPDIRQVRPEIPDELADLVRACLAKDPGERPASGTDLFDRLQGIYRSLRDLPSLAEDALRDLDARWSQQDDGRLEIDVRLEGNRRQRVWIEETASDLSATALVRIFSICAPVCEEYMRKALELNAEMPHGALAIQTLEDTPHFVVINSYPRATCDVEELRHSVRDVAAWADRVEQALTDDDKF